MADIAIIGSSLIMSFYARILSSKNKVCVYESSNIGGSWAANKFQEAIHPLFNNLICPLNDEEDDIIEPVAKFLNEAGGNVEIRNEKLNLLIDYEPKKYIVGDFFSAIRNNINTVSEINREKVSSIEIMNDGINLNGRFFNKIFLPENFIVDSIVYAGKTFPMEQTSVISKHLRAFVSSAKDLPYYNESTDGIFDRGGKVDDHIFIGRIRKECKDFNEARFISESSILSTRAVMEYQINKYHNSRLTEASLDFLKSLAPPNTFFAETAQFCRSYIKLRDNLFSDRSLLNKLVN